MTHTIYSGRYAPLPDRLVHEAWQERTARYRELGSLQQGQTLGQDAQGAIHREEGQFIQDFATVLSKLEKGQAGNIAKPQPAPSWQPHNSFNMGMVPLPIYHPGNLAGYFNQENIERGDKRKVTPVVAIET